MRRSHPWWAWAPRRCIAPNAGSSKEVQDYLIFLHDQRGLTWQSCNCARHGIRFFYRITLGLPEPHFYLPGAKTPSILPELLNHDELVRLFSVTTNRKHRALLTTAYAAGLRASELGRLRISDIDSQRMFLRIDQGKVCMRLGQIPSSTVSCHRWSSDGRAT